MNDYLKEVLDDIYSIADDSREEFNKGYDKIINILQDSFTRNGIDVSKFYIYPVGEYDYGTSIEDLAPYKIIFEYSCKKEDVVKKINYLKDSGKKGVKAQLMMRAVTQDVLSTYTNLEIAEMIENIIKSSNFNIGTTIKQNSVFARIIDNEKEYNYVIIVAYKFSDDEYLRFKYKGQNVKLNYDKYCENFAKKNDATDGIYADVVVLYKYFEFALLLDEQIDYKTLTEFNLYENLLYNVPNKLFSNDRYLTIKNTVNYLSNVDVEQLKTVDDVCMADNKFEKEILKQYIYKITNNAILFDKSMEYDDID